MPSSSPLSLARGATAACALTLAACSASLPTINPLSDVRQSGEMGIVLMSAGCNECPLPGFTLQAVGNPKQSHELHGGGSTAHNERIEFPLPFSAKHAGETYPADYTGRILLAQLPAGEYEIVRLNSWQRWGNVKFNGAVAPGMRLSIKPGVLNYAGELMVLFEPSKAKQGFDFRVTDQQERDPALARQAKPVLQGIPVRMGLLQR